MCGRFTISLAEQLVIQEFNIKNILAHFKPNYNVAPMQLVPVVIKGRTLDTYRWGLIPHWAHNPKLAYKMINARAETVAEKPAYRSAFKHRCLIVADGFYEWKKEGKIPYRFTLKDRKVFGFAGISSEWKSPKGVIKTCSIITTNANSVVKKIHDRMPVIIQKKDEDNWLDPDFEAKKLLKAYPSTKIQAQEVSTMVNSPKNNSPECIKPV